MTKLNFNNLHSKKEYLEVLKQYQNELLAERKNQLTDKLSGETITLYHGTSSHYLADILKNGLRPRKCTNNSNYDDSNPSNESLVYLSNYWHYFYAFMTTNINLQNYEKEHDVDLRDEKTDDETGFYEAYYRLTGDMPIVIEVEVPVEWLTYDEDIAYFNPFLQDVKSGNIQNPGDVDYRYSMQQFTCACMEAIPVSMIKSIEVIAYYDLDYILDKRCDYAQIYGRWTYGRKIEEEELAEALELAIEEMKDYHLGAFEEIDVSNPNTKLIYHDTCVYIDRH